MANLQNRNLRNNINKGGAGDRRRSTQVRVYNGENQHARFLSSKQQTHPELILMATNQGWIKALCFYYLCKNRFVNSTMFNYRVSRLAAITKVSPYLVKIYVEQLQDHRLARKHSGNLIFISTDKAKRMFATELLTRKFTIHLTPGDNIQDIKSKLLAKLVEFETGKQAYMITIKEKFNSLINPDRRHNKRIIRIRNLRRKYDFSSNGEKVDKRIGFSYRLSVSNVFTCLKHAERLAIIKLNVTQPQALYMNGKPHKMNPHDFAMVRDVLSDQVKSYAYLSRQNEILFQGSTKIDLLEYPLKKAS